MATIQYIKDVPLVTEVNLTDKMPASQNDTEAHTISVGQIIDKHLADTNHLELGETSTTAYAGDKGKAAYDHISLTNDPHNTQWDQLGGLSSYIPLDTTPDVTPPTQVGVVSWNSTEDCVDIQGTNVTYQVGQELAPLYRNATGSTILNMTPVMFAGSVGASGRLKIQKAIADGSLPTHYTIGLCTENIANGSDGHVTWFGKVRGIDTTGTAYGETWVDGDILYVSPTTAGALTKVKPDAPSLQIAIAAVTYSHHTTGSLMVRPAWEGRLQDLSDVNGTPLTATGQFLVWNATGGYFDATSNIDDYEPANSNIQAHITSTANPHSVTYSQVGAEPANANIQTHISSTSNPHNVTKTQVGLGNVLNAEQEVVSTKGQALGYCPLDSGAKVAETYLPDSVLGQVDYQGTWNATTNTPAIPTASSANKGWYYIVAVSGTATVDAISEWTVGDWIISNGATWNKVDNTDSVSSVFGRAGTIVANSGDYTASQVTNAPQGNIAAITVQAAINELDSEKASTTDSRFVTNGDSHDHVGGDGAAISLTDAVTGILPVSKGGTGVSSLSSERLLVTNTGGTAVNTVGSTVLGQVLLAAPTGGPSFGALPLGNSNAVSGTLPVANGGTGSSTQNFVDLTTDQSVAGTKTFSSTVVLPTGTASLPSLTTAGDTDTGVHFPAANTVGIATGGSDAFTVGLETGIPVIRYKGYPFIFGSTTDASDKRGYIVSQQYSSTTEPEGFFVIGGYGYNGGNQVAIGGMPAAYNAATAITFSTASDTVTRSGSERMRITNDGKILIGAATDPTSISGLKQWANGIIASTSMHVGYIGYSTYGSFTLTRSGQSAAGQTDRLVLDIKTGTGAARFFHYNVDASTISATYTINRSGYHMWDTGNSGTELMRLTAAGNLLVGTTTDLDSNYPVQVLRSADAGIGFYAKNTSTGTSASSRLLLQTADNTQFSVVKYNSTHSLFPKHTHFYTSDPSGDFLFSPGGSEKVRMTAGGNVLVGTATDPGYGAKIHSTAGISLGNSAVADGRVLDWYEEGTFTATATGMTTSPTGAVKYTRIGNNVTLDLPAITGTSNATTFTLTRLSSQLRPAANKVVAIRCQDNGGAFVYSYAIIGTDGTITCYRDANGSVFTESGAKTVGAQSVTYTLQ